MTKIATKISGRVIGTHNDIYSKLYIYNCLAASFVNQDLTKNLADMFKQHGEKALLDKLIFSKNNAGTTISITSKKAINDALSLMVEYGFSDEAFHIKKFNSDYLQETNMNEEIVGKRPRRT